MPPPHAFFRMAAPNTDRSCRGGLDNLVVPDEDKRADPTERNKNGVTAWAFVRPDGGLATFLDPFLLEARLDEDESLAAAIIAIAANHKGMLKPGTNAAERALKIIGKHVDRIFADKVLVDIVELFAGIRDLVTEYVLAKGLDQAALEERFRELRA